MDRLSCCGHSNFNLGTFSHRMACLLHSLQNKQSHCCINCSSTTLWMFFLWCVTLCSSLLSAFRMLHFSLFLLSHPFTLCFFTTHSPVFAPFLLFSCGTAADLSFLFVPRVSFSVACGPPEPLGLSELHRARSRGRLHRRKQHSDPRNPFPVHPRLQRSSSGRSSVCQGKADSLTHNAAT